MIELETLKKKIIYRANYRGTKEMDILLSKFVDKYINKFSKEDVNGSIIPCNEFAFFRVGNLAGCGVPFCTGRPRSVNY